MLNTCAELLANKLRSQDLHFDSTVTESGASLIQLPYSGKVARLFFSGENGTYLSLYLVFERVPEEKVADLIFTCNALNSEYKWVKFYLDNDNDIILEDDAILSVDDPGEEAFELLVRMIKLADEAKPRIMKDIYA